MFYLSLISYNQFNIANNFISSHFKFSYYFKGVVIKLYFTILLKLVVMKPNIQTKKNKSNSKSKSKSKGKSKSKSKKQLFDPIKYLNKIVDIPVGQLNRNPKYKSKQIGSALTAATPILSRNISNKKLKCKSSHSQYKGINPRIMKDLANINFNMYITEQDNIKFTETESISNKPHKKQTKQIKDINKYKYILCQSNAAMVIQRAWRKYKILKMVKTYQDYFGQERQQQFLSEISLDKTLKFQSGKKQIQPHDETIKNSKQQFIEQEKITNLLATPSSKHKKSFQYSNFLQYQEQKSKEIEKCQKMMNLISNSRIDQSKEKFFLQNIIEKIQKNKSNLIMQIQKQSKFKALICREDIKEQQINFEQQLLDSNDCGIFNKPNHRQKIPELKLITNKIMSLHQTKQRQIEKYVILKSIDRITDGQFQNKQIQLTKRYNNEIRYLQKTKKQYQMYLEIIERIAIDSHRKLINSSTSKKYLKRAFSVGNIIYKCMLIENKINQMDVEMNVPLETMNLSKNGLVLSEKQEKQKQQQEKFGEEILINNERVISSQSVLSSSIHETSDICIDLVIEQDSDKLQPSKNQKCVKKYTQGIQRQVQVIIIQQLVSQIYLSSQLYKHFKPHIQKMIKFPPITDYQIYQFIRQIMKYAPPMDQLLKLFNQKINPASWQILRIIRDPQFELNDYQLILDEEVFRKYRIFCQDRFIKKKDKVLANIKSVTYQQSFLTEKLKEAIQQRQQEYKRKLQRYLTFEKDIRLIYMRSVYNCLNQYLIQAISFSCYINSRSAIGPGQLSNALKEYNTQYSQHQISLTFKQVQDRIHKILKYKCTIPTYRNYLQMMHSQIQAQKQIKIQFEQTQHKWVNHMDQILEIWEETYVEIFENIILQAVYQISRIALK